MSGLRLNGWRQPKKGRWKVVLEPFTGPTALTCGAIVAVLAALALLPGDWALSHTPHWLSFGLAAGLTRYTWTDVHQLEDSVAAGRFSAEINRRVGGMENYSMSGRRDVALAELLATTPEVLNLRAFCEVVDGVTDNVAAFKAVADRLRTSGGGVYIPAGTFTTSALIYWPSNVHVMGAGRGATVIKRIGLTDDTPDNTGGVFGTGSADGVNYTLGSRGTNVTFSDFTLDGNYTGNTLTDTGPHADGMHIQYTDEITVTRVTSKNCYNSGYYLFGCKRSSWSQSWAISNGHLNALASRNGFSITGLAANATPDVQDEHIFSNCQSIGNLNAGFTFGNVGVVIYANNIVKDNLTHGIEGDSETGTAATNVTSKVVLVGNIITATTGAAITVANLNIQKLIVQGNEIDTCSQSGIDANFTSGSICSITGNLVRAYGSAGATYHGINVGTFDLMNVSTNTIWDGHASSGSGIALQDQAGARYGNIEGNVIRSPGRSGIAVRGYFTGIVGRNTVVAPQNAGSHCIDINPTTTDIVNLVLDTNTCMNANGGSGIAFRCTGAGNVTSPILKNNTCVDNQSPKTQTFGLLVSETSTGRVTKLKLDHNEFEGNLTGHVSGLTDTHLSAGYIRLALRQQTIAIASGAIIPNTFNGEDVLPLPLTGAMAVGIPLNPFKGLRLRFHFVQDVVGGRAVTFDTIFRHTWSDTGNTANKQSTIEFRFDGASWTQELAQGPYV